MMLLSSARIYKTRIVSTGVTTDTGASGIPLVCRMLVSNILVRQNGRTLASHIPYFWYEM